MPFKELKKRDGTDKPAAQQGGSFQSVRILVTGSSIHDSRQAQDLVARVDYPRPYARAALGIDEDRNERPNNSMWRQEYGNGCPGKFQEGCCGCWEDAKPAKDTLGRFGGL